MITDSDSFSKSRSEVGAVYNPMFIGIPIFIGAIGLYKMKKWGAWVYMGAMTINALMGFSESAKYNAVAEVSPFLSFVVPGLCIGVVLYYYKYFTDNYADNSLKESFNPLNNDITSNTFTDASVSNNISKENNTIEEIEKLFQMKEKGIISDEDFKLMKEKIINSN
jgi:hypothetical protein